MNKREVSRLLHKQRVTPHDGAALHQALLFCEEGGLDAAWRQLKTRLERLQRTEIARRMQEEQDMNRYQRTFPVGTRVLAFTEDGMMPGRVSIHTEDRENGNGLIVTFDDGSYVEYPYSTLDISAPENSYVVREGERRP